MNDLANRLRDQWEPGGDIYAAADLIEKLEATIRSCIIAMRVSQRSKYPTDWTAMVAALESTVGDPNGNE